MADGVYSRRFQTIAQMARDAAGEVTSSVEAWKRFHNTAGEVYRYPFMDQLLIYKQRPDAKAVATMDYWNKHMKCWIKRGSKGIALIDEDLGSGKLKYHYEDENLTIKALMKIKLLKRYQPDKFTFDVLKDEYGIFAIRGPRGITNSLSEALKQGED